MTHCALNYSLIHRSEVVVQVARRPQMELLNRGRLAVVHHNDQPGPKRTCLIHPTATRGRSDLSEVCVLHLVVWRHTEVVEPIQCASSQHTHIGTRPDQTEVNIREWAGRRSTPSQSRLESLVPCASILS